MNTSQVAIQLFLLDYKSQLENLDKTPVDHPRLTALLYDLQQRFLTLHATLQACTDRIPTVVRQQVHQLGQHFETQQKRLQSHNAPLIKESLAQHYEHFLHQLRQQPSCHVIVNKVGTLRPKNYSRSLAHIANSLIAFSLYEWIFTRDETMFWLSLFLVSYMALDLIRRYSPALNRLVFQRLLGAVTRPRELYQTPSGIWYVGGLLFAAIVAPQTAALCAVLTLGFGDPAASFFGKKYGRIAIGKNRTLIGSAAFVVSTMCIVGLFLISMRSFDPTTALWWATICGFSGALGEYLSNDRFDDNLLIPATVSLTFAILYGFA